MIGLFIALLLIWLGYKLYKASKEPPKIESEDTKISYTIPFGYIKDGETAGDLV